MTASPADYEDTSWSDRYSKYRGYKKNYPSLGSATSSGTMSFTPDEIVFQAEKINSDGSVSGK